MSSKVNRAARRAYGTVRTVTRTAYRPAEEERETPESQAVRTVRDRFVAGRRIALLTGSRRTVRDVNNKGKTEQPSESVHRTACHTAERERNAVRQENFMTDPRKERFRASFFREKIRRENAASDNLPGWDVVPERKRVFRLPQFRVPDGILPAAAAAVCVLTVLVTTLAAGVAASPYGIFFAAEAVEEKEGIRAAVRDLSLEFYGLIRAARENTEWDRLEMVSDDGCCGVRWDAVLPVFAVLQGTGGGTGAGVAEIGEAEKAVLRELMYRSASVSWYLEEIPEEEKEEAEQAEEEKEEEEPEEKEEKEEEEEEPRTVRVLHITVTHTDPADAAGLDAAQRELLAEMTGPANSAMWAKLLGGLTAGGGIMEPDPSRIPAGDLTWPLPEPGRISSGFGTRTDPFDGTQKFHGGLDIAAAGGTPVLAAADGAVVTANATDPWGGGYGYYVILDHGNGLQTLYAHCSSVCVLPGAAAVRGEVIGYVGSTGNSTGDHLHFEVRVNGEKTDPMLYFQS